MISEHTVSCAKVSQKSAQGHRIICGGKKITRRWADVQRDGYPAKHTVHGALCESSIIPFLIARHKFWLAPPS